MCSTPPQFLSYYKGKSSKFQKSWTLKIQTLKPAVCLQNDNKFKFKRQLPKDELKINQRSY